MEDKLFLTRKWLLDSGIQNVSGDNEGGFNAWYDLDTASYSFVYSEITGYGLTTLLFLQNKYGGDYLEKAEKGADWLIKKALHECGGVRTRSYLQDLDDYEKYSFESENIFAFDNGMVIYGLLNLYKMTGAENILRTASNIADFLLDHMHRGDGSFYAIYNPVNDKKEDSEWKWSSQDGSYHAKLTLGFLDLYEITGKDIYRDVSQKICDHAMTFQQDDGRFVTSRNDNSTHLHPHSYSAEGLMYAGKKLGRKDYIEASIKALKWALDIQLDDGGIPKYFENGRPIPLYRTDILAQVLRLGVLADCEQPLDNIYRGKLDRLKNKLLEFQLDDNEIQSGGFYYGFNLRGEKKNHLNSWCTMFAVQAISMYADRFVRGDEVKMEYFI